MEPKNPPIEKEKSSSKPPFFGFKMLIFQGVSSNPSKNSQKFNGPQKILRNPRIFWFPPKTVTISRPGYDIFLPHQFRGATKKTQPNIHQTVAIWTGNEKFPPETTWECANPVGGVCTNMMCSNVHLYIYRHDCMNENHQFSFIINFLLNHFWLSMMTQVSLTLAF